VGRLVKTLALCLPRYGAPEPEHQACLEALLVTLEGRYRAGIAEATGPNVDIVRARIAALAAPMELWLWLDADMVFDAEEVLRMVDEADQRDAVVGGLYTSKSRDGSVQGRPEASELACFDGGGVVPARAVGFGCVAMPGRLYGRIAEHLGVRPVAGVGTEAVLPLFQPIVDDAGYHSDDYSFCIRARAAGVPVLIDTRPRLGHVGRYTYYLDDPTPREHAASLTLRLGDRP
jgi:hypothetical protein